MYPGRLGAVDIFARRGSLSGGNSQRSVVVTLLACAASVIAILSATRGLIQVNLGTPFVVLGAVGLLFLGWRRWELGIQSLLVIVIVEGALRKWFLPSYADLIYFYKDALMVAIILGYFMHEHKAPFVIKRDIQLVVVMVFAFIIYAISVAANPSAPHFLTNLFGIKAYCLYMPLVFFVPRMFPTKEKLVAFLRWYLVIALMVSAIGGWQFVDNRRDSELNRYAHEAAAGQPQDTAIFADSSGDYFVRVTSTFSFISGLTVYLPVAFALLLGLTSLGATKSLPISVRLIYYLGIAGVVVTAFMSGSRGVIVNLLIVAVIFFAFTSLKNAFKRFRQVIIGGACIFLALNLVAPQAVDGLYQRAFGGEEQIDEGRERIASVFSFPFDEAGYAGPFGYGIGATQNSVPALMNRLSLSHTGEPIPLAVESESSRVMLELGVVGFVLFTLMRLALIITTFSACLVIRDPEMKALAVAGFANLLFFIVVGGGVINHTQNVYQWFLVGMVFALLNADKLARATQPAPTDSSRIPVGRGTWSTQIPALDRR